MEHFDSRLEEVNNRKLNHKGNHNENHKEHIKDVYGISVPIE